MVQHTHTHTREEREGGRERERKREKEREKERESVHTLEIVNKSVLALFNTFEDILKYVLFF